MAFVPADCSPWRASVVNVVNPARRGRRPPLARASLALLLAGGAFVLAGGSLVPRAARAARPERLGAAMAGIRRLDTDGDGRLSRAEHAAAARKLFEGMDADRDGRLTAAEMDAAYAKVKGRRPSRSMKARNLKGAERIRLMDRDGDGVVTAAEHSADATASFDKMDQDKDGLVTQAELANNHAKVLRKSPARRR